MKPYPTKFVNFFKMNSPGEQTEIFVKFMCKTFVTFTTQKPSINYQESTFDTSNTPLTEIIAQAIENIFQRQTNAFKINLSFSFILQHRETGEFRYHYASNNNQFPTKFPMTDLKPTRSREPSGLSCLSKFSVSP